MPKRTDIRKVLVIGSGPIVIGQAAEFDYAGTQACLALKEEGYEVILANSNPATIMTDTSVADKVYMEPLTLEFLARICRMERPDAIVPGIGGKNWKCLFGCDTEYAIAYQDIKQIGPDVIMVDVP